MEQRLAAVEADTRTDIQQAQIDDGRAAEQRAKYAGRVHP